MLEINRINQVRVSPRITQTCLRFNSFPSQKDRFWVEPRPRWVAARLPELPGPFGGGGLGQRDGALQRRRSCERPSTATATDRGGHVELEGSGSGSK